jgi:hypothetical protein
LEGVAEFVVVGVDIILYIHGYGSWLNDQYHCRVAAITDLERSLNIMM